MNIINDEAWHKLLPIIVLLFKRNKNATIWNQDWVTWSYHYKSDMTVMHCHICDKSIEISSGNYLLLSNDSQVARKHAFLHLKENNLLPFI